MTINPVPTTVLQNKIPNINYDAKTALASLGRTIVLTVRQSPIRIALLLCVKLVQSSIPIFQIYVTRNLVNELALLIQHGQSYLRESALVLLMQLCLMMLGAFAGGVTSILSRQIQYKIKYRFDQLISSKTTKIPFSFYNQPEFYNLFQRASGHSQLASTLVDQLLQIVQSTITLIAYVIILYNIHYALSLGLILLSVPVVVTNIVMGKSRYKNVRRQTHTLRKAKYLYELLTGKESAKELRIFNYDKFLSSRWSDLFWKSAHEQISFEKKNAFVQICIGLLNNLVIVFVLGILFWLGSIGRMTMGLYVSISQAFITAQGQMHTLARNISRVHESSLFLSDLFTFLRLQEELDNPQSIAFPMPLKEGIRVDNVYFYHQNNSKATLKGISFQIKKGQKVAIVGENGSGKSTLINCLLGLYIPQEGHVYFDNVELREVDAKSLRDNATVVFQDFVRYQLSLAENIGLGMVENIQDKAKVELAAKSTGINFVGNLENGFDTILGTSFEGGNGLSGGQWQRISLGRAFFKNAQIIILDEPTSTFDPVAEQLFYKEIFEISKDKTAIFISHRLGICPDVDLILVLKDGKILEQGSHLDLLDKNGNYAEMYEKQMGSHSEHQASHIAGGGL